MPSVTTFWTMPLMSALPSLAFVCPSNWGSVSLTLMTAVRPSRTSSPERFASFSESVPDLRDQVQRGRERRAESGHVRAAVDGVDVVREGDDGLGEGIVVLERDLDARRADEALDVDRARVEHVTAPIQMPHEARHAALEEEVLLRGRSLVAKPDPEALVEVGRLTQASADRLPAEVERLEHLRVGPEERAGPVRPLPGRSRPRFASAASRLPDRALRAASNSWTWRLPSRRTSTRISELSAFTTLTPTPWRPPETL